MYDIRNINVVSRGYFFNFQARMLGEGRGKKLAKKYNTDFF